MRANRNGTNHVVKGICKKDSGNVLKEEKICNEMEQDGSDDKIIEYSTKGRK